MELLNKIFDELNIVKHKQLIKLFFLVISLILIWFILPVLNYNIKIWIFSLDLIIKIVLTIMVLIICYYLMFFAEKNKSDLPGIGFYIASSNIDINDISGDILFKRLKECLSNEYNFLIYKENVKRKYNKNPYKLMSKLNLSFLFEVSEVIGNRNGKQVYELKIFKVHYILPFPIPNKEFEERFNNELMNSINTYLRIPKDNNLDYINNESKSFENSMDYIKSILLLISKNPENSIELCRKLDNFFKNKSKLSDQQKYIKFHISQLLLDAHICTIYKCLSLPYYMDIELLKELEKYENQYISLLKNYNRNNKITKKEYHKLINETYLTNAIILYEKKNYNNAMLEINKCDLTLPSFTAPLFSKAYLLAHLGKYMDSYMLYEKLGRRSHESTIAVIDFIEKRSDYDSSNESNMFCLAIVNYYFKDKDLAIRLLNDLSERNDNIRQVMEYMNRS